MTGSGRLRVLAVSFVLMAAGLVVAGPQAWAAVHDEATRCARPPAVGDAGSVIHSSRTVATHGSWRAHTLGAAGCGAWRQMHAHNHHGRH